MLTEERYEIILDALKKKERMSVAELVEVTNASEATIRRDIIALDEEGKLRKIRGGAGAIQDGGFVNIELSYTEKEQIHRPEKLVIGEYAASLVKDDDFIFIDAGTSTAAMIEYLKPTNAVFVTNGIANANSLIAKGLTTYLIGGRIKPGTLAIVGNEGVESLKKYNFTKCFLGTNGIHFERGFTTVDTDEASIKQEALSRSFLKVILADSSKFSQIAAVSFGKIDDAVIITDKVINDKYKDATTIKEVSK